MSSNSESDTTLDQTLKESVSILFDPIRFPQYRVACKLRYLQKVSKFNEIDLFNTIESFREFGLNADSDLTAIMPITQTYSIIHSIYSQLSQRMPKTNMIDVETCSTLVHDWIINTFEVSQNSFINVFAFKIALILLCSSAYSNKLRYFFTLLCNTTDHLVQSRFELFLEYLLAIPKYFDNETIFTFNEDFQMSIFDFSAPITLQKFLEVLTCFESQVETTSWLIVYHRLPDAEEVSHSIACNVCRKNPFTGFRYKCKQCSNYNLCQDCFWTGRASQNHDPNKHPCKEYLMDKTKSHLRRSLRNSLRNSFRCFPSKSPQILPAANNADNLIKKRLNLSNIISTKSPMSPTSPMYEYVFKDITSECSEVPNYSSDEEHKLIAHYLYLLKNQNGSNQNSIQETNDISGYEKMIETLEGRNRDLMKRIAEMKIKNGQLSQNTAGSKDSLFLNELVSLRRKKDELESHLNTLSEKRKHLVHQLNALLNEFQKTGDPSLLGPSAFHMAQPIRGEFANGGNSLHF